MTTRELSSEEFQSIVVEAMGRLRRRMEGCTPRWLVAWGHLLDGAIEEVLEERERSAASSRPRAGG